MTTQIRIAVRKFNPFESAIRKQFADFSATHLNDVHIEIEALDLNPLHDALFARNCLRDGSFDIAFLSTDWISQAQQANLIENLTPYLERTPIADFPDAWSPSLLKFQQFRGGFWGTPYHDGPECLIFRKDLLAEAELPVPTTWSEFHAAARRLHAPEQGRYGTVLALFPDGHNTLYDFCIHVWTRGGEPFNADAHPNLHTPQAIAALDFIRNLARDEHAIAPHARNLDSVKAGLMFCEGKIALMANWFGFAALGETWKESTVKGLVDIAPLPAGDGGVSASLNVYWVLAIAAGSKKKELAWSFLRHLATAPMDKLTTTEGAIGVRYSTWRDTEINRIIPYYHKLSGLHERARELPRHPKLADISHVIDDVLKEAVLGNVPSGVLLASAQRRVKDIIA